MIDDGSQVYRDLMRLKPEGWTANAWAVNAGVSRTVWSDMRKHGNPSRRTLQKLLAAAGSSLAEFEALRIPDRRQNQGSAVGDAVAEVPGSGWQSSATPALPLVATSQAGDMKAQSSRIGTIEYRLGEIVEQLPRPSSLASDPGAFALTIVNEAMWPRFREERRVAVSPKAPVVAGDDVVVALGSRQADGRTTAVIGELADRTSEFVAIRQFNPDQTFRIDARQVLAIHKVMGELF